MEKKQDKSPLGFVNVKSVVTFLISAITFVVISWIYFYPGDVQGDVMQPGDVMQGQAIGHEIQQFKESTGEVSRWTNAMFGGMPSFQINPSYDSSSMLGMVSKIYSLKFLGTPDPVSWLFMLMLGFFILMLAFDMKWYYAVLGAVGYGFSSYFFIIMGAGHIWKLLTLCYIPPTIAGVVLCYRGKWLAGGALAALFGALQLMSNHVQMSYYFGFVIVALMVAYLCIAIKEKTVARWGIATAVLMVAGGLALASNAPNLYMSYKYAKETMRGGHSDLSDGGDGQASKGGVEARSGGLSKEYITQWSYGKGETFTLMVPNVQGGASLKPTKSDQDPSQIVNMPMTLDQTGKAQDMMSKGEMNPVDSQCMPYFSQYFGDQPMTNGPVYVGALICALFLLGCVVVKGPIKWALLAVTLLSIFLSWGHNMMWLSSLFVDYFPLYNKFRTVSSILVIAEFTMPLMAVLAVKEMFSDDDFLKKHQKALFATFGISAGLCLLFAVMPGLFVNFTAADQQTYDSIKAQLQQEPATLRPTIDAGRAAMVSADAWRSLAIIAVGFVIIFAYLKRYVKVDAAVATLLVALVVMIDMYAVNKRYINQDSFVSKYDLKPVNFEKRPADVQVLKDTAQNYRVLDVQGFMSGNASYYHKTVGGYHPAKLVRFNDLLERQLTKNGRLNIAQTQQGAIDFDKMSVWNMLNTKYIIVDPNTAILNPAALGNAWFVDSLTYVNNADEEMKFLDNFNAAHHAVADKQFASVLGNATATSPGDTIIETSYAPNRLSFHSHSAQGGVAVLSEIYFPWGWNVTIDGKDVQLGRVNYVLRALRVPAGDHNIVMTFKPQEVDTTDGVAKGAILLIFLGMIAAIVVPIVMGRCPKNIDETVA